MHPSSFAADFLGSLPVVKLSNLWAHQQCDICQEPFFKWVEKPLELPCGHIFGSTCLVEWLSPAAVDLTPKNTCPICREVLFSESTRRYWEDTPYEPGSLVEYPPVPLLTTAALGDPQPAITHPVLLARLIEAQNRGSTGDGSEVGPAAEALALLRVVIGELSGRGTSTGGEAADLIPASVIDGAVLSLAAQMGRLYEYYQSRINKETTSISWDSEGPEVSVLRDPVWARWCEWQLQELVFMERNSE